MKKIKVFGYFISLIMPFMFVSNVFASTSFTTCTFTENSYLRSTPGGSAITDTDGSTFLINSPRRAEVIDTTTLSGKTYKKLKINYYSNNYIGWVWDGYLKDFKTYTTSNDYENSLRNAGFPETYITPLAKLKAVYPNWNFIVSKNGSGLDWNSVINEEYTPVYKNLLCSSNLNAIKPLLSTDGAAYNAGTYKKFDNGTCYAPSKQTISFYMDPRNWLNDNTIFMFEQLSFNEQLHTTNAIQTILNNTFMSGSYTYNGKNISYAQTFVDAGKQNNVSSVQIASRVLQEQGTSGNSATINMKDGLNTYYNFFNIGATGNSQSEIITNALNYAKSKGWNNPYTSIVGGSSLISNGYTKAGQDTNYYQKFNTINNSSLYWNQYMANVRVNPSEAISMYNTYYKNNLLNSSFTFKIPVYNNMPEATTLSTTQNADNTLSSLSVSNCTFTQEFNSSVTNYSCNVNSSVSSVNVSAKATSSFSSVTSTGSKTLSTGNNKIEVKVTAANGDVKTYTININKENSNTSSKKTPSDIMSSLGLNNSSNIISGIELNTNVSTIINNIKSKESTAVIKVVNKETQEKSSGNIATGDKFTITSNNVTTTFTISIKGDASGDGNIDISDLAIVKAYMLNKTSLSGANLKASDINNDDKVDISDLAMIKAHMLGKIKISK